MNKQQIQKIRKIIRIANSKHEYLKEGEKVKIDYKKITESPNFKNSQKEYIEWIENNKENVFTVEYDENHKKNPVLIQLKEDTTVPKWLFWEGYLKRIEG